MATPDETKAQIVAIVEQYSADVKAVREDITLSPLGRYRGLQQLYDTTSQQVANLRSTLDQNTNGDRRTLERRLFGLPSGADASDVVSYRDAQDRVADAKRAEDLGELMERAAGSGDEMLLRAGFARAWRESLNPMGSDVWADLVSEYLDQHPASRRDAEALTQLSPRGMTATFLERMRMTVTKPAELNRPESSFSDQTLAQDTPQLMTRTVASGPR